MHVFDVYVCVCVYVSVCLSCLCYCSTEYTITCYTFRIMLHVGSIFLVSLAFSFASATFSTTDGGVQQRIWGFLWSLFDIFGRVMSLALLGVAKKVQNSSLNIDEFDNETSKTLRHQMWQKRPIFAKLKNQLT